MSQLRKLCKFLHSLAFKSATHKLNDLLVKSGFPVIKAKRFDRRGKSIRALAERRMAVHQLLCR